jgi:hypothetical protein
VVEGTNGGISRGRPDAEAVAANVRSVLAKIQQVAKRVGRDPAAIRLVAATKAVTVEQIRAGLGAGLTILGENRLQEAMDKMQAIGDRAVHWHFIGRLQRRKVKSVVGRFELIHSVDSLELATEIARRAEKADLRQAVLLEVNVGAESTKTGFAPTALAEVVPLIGSLPSLVVEGLMTIPPRVSNPEEARPYFRRLRELASSLQAMEAPNLRFNELSMGMTHDYEVAIEEGATYVRIGTALFGARDE